MGERRIADQRADPQPAVGQLFDVFQRQAVDVDDRFWMHNIVFHQVNEIGTAREDESARIG
ncbi:hypothetical protein D3C71_1907010 [compost metagenome]